MKDKDWERLLWNIQRQSCILLLGPETLPRDHPLSPATLSRQLAADLNLSGDDLPLAYVAHQYVASPEMGRDDLEREVIRFYQKTAPTPPIYQDLAAMPFPFTLSTCHDDLLVRAFREQGKSPSTSFYKYGGIAQDLAPNGTVQAPVVFSLFGSPSDPRSLVLTENNLLDMLVAVITNNPALPANVTSELKNKNISFLFLGFGMHQWYLRILLHVLQLNQTGARSFAMEPLDAASAQALDPVVLFFKVGYRIEIINCELAPFVSELRTRLAAQPSLAVNGAASTPADVSPKVFLCYAHEDGDQAERVYTALRGAGLDVWMDRSNLVGGEVWDRTIQERLNDSDYFIVLTSPSLAQKSFSYVNKEINLALERQRYARSGIRFIIPVQLPNAPLLPDLKDFQAVGIDSDANVATLISTIRRDYQRRNRG